MEGDDDGDSQDLLGPAHLEEEYGSDTESVSSDISTRSSTDGEMTSTLYLGNFPPHIKKQQISKHFSEHGYGDNVVRVTIFTDKVTHKSKGCGIVTVTPATIAESIIHTLNGTLLCGRHQLAVELRRPNRKRNPKKKAGTKSKQPITPEKCYPAGRLVGMGSSPRSNPSDAIESLTLDDSDNESVSSTPEEFCKVFVNSSPPFSNDINSGHLRKHFKQFKGEILNAQIIRDKETKQTKGYGIITFSLLSTAENVIRNMNGSRLHGKFCIKLHTDKQSGRRQKPQPVPHPPLLYQGPQAASSQEKLSSCLLEDSLGFGDSNNESVSPISGESVVFVASNPPLPNFVNNRHLQDHFSEFSQDVMDVRVIQDKETRKSKGYAFITFSSLAAASSAIQAKNGTLLLGKHKLKLEYERGSEKRKSRPSANQHPQAQGMVQATDAFQPTGTSITDAGYPFHQSNIPSTPQLHSPPEAVLNDLVVENLNPIISEDEIKAVIGLPISSCIFEVTGSDRKRAKIHCQVPSDALAAVLQLDGKQLLGHTAHAYLAPPNTPAPFMQAQPQPQPTSYPVKVTHLAPTVTKEKLSCHFSVAGEVLSCTIHPSKNTYAHVNFKDEQTARKAVAMLNGSILDGWKINVSPKFGKAPLPENLSPPHLQPAIAQQSPPPGKPETVPVKVSNLPLGIQEKDIFEAFKCYGRIESIRVVPSNPPYAHVNYFSVTDAKTASANLHETYLGGNKIRVQLKFPASGTNVPSPVNQQPTNDQATGDLQTGLPEQEEKAMKLKPDQWNKLMNVGSHGASLFQELIGPFKSNPNVTIQPLIDQLTIRFVGVHDAVWSAYSHIANQLNKELHIPDRVKMAALLEIYPNLASNITQKHHISVSGYQEGSSVIKFEGPPTGVEAARAEIDVLVCRSLSTELDIAFPSTLLASARKRFQADKIQAHVSTLPHSVVPKVTVCAFSKNDHDQAVKVLTDGPCERFVPVHTQDAIDQIKVHPHQSFAKLSADFSVAIHAATSMVTIQGFLLHDVQSVQKLLNKLVKELSVKVVPLSCTPEQTAYLKHVLIDHPSEEAKSLVSTLRAAVSYSKGKIFISGTPETVEEAKAQLIGGSLLDGLQYRLFRFNCHFKFLSQIELYVLRPFQHRNLDFIYTIESEKPTKGCGKQERTAPKTDEQVFKIIVFSREPVVFEEVCLALEPLAPKSRYFPIQSRALEYVKNEQSNYEQRHRVRLLSQLKGGSASIIIHGLTTEEIDQCWEEIEQLISSTLVVVKHIPIDIYQAKYLRLKYTSELEQLRTECMELQLPLTKDPAHSRRDDSLSIRIKGTKKQVETVQERTMELIGADFTTVTFEVKCRPKYYRMWVKRWTDVKREQEERNDVIIEFSQSHGRDRRSSNPLNDSEPDTTVSFTVFGADPDGVKEVEDVIRTQENGHLMDHKQIPLSHKSTVTLLKGMSSKELILSHQVNVDIDKKANQVTLSSPLAVSDDLDAAEETIQRFIGNRAVTSKEIVCEDPVVGLVLNSRSMSVRYFSIANTVAKPHNVSVRPLRKPFVGLVLRGSQAAVQTVEPIIRAIVIKPIEDNIGQLQITVERIYAPLFTTREFKVLDDKLQEDLCVVSSYPRIGKQSRVLRSILIRSSPSSHCLKLEVCRGNLVFEQVDAIVNAANEDLKHIGGLAKAILNAGGATIQTESDNYVGLHGKLKAEDAICLGAGKLPCKKVIHAVGPRWRGGKQNEEHSLYFTIYNALSTAERENIGSVALPAISTGVFDVPEDICARASIKAVRDYCQANPTSIIHSVRFVLFTQGVAEKFLTFLDSGIFDGCIVQPASSTSSISTAAIPASPYNWLWENDHGSFTHFPGDVSSSLTKEYLQNPGGAINCTLNGKMYKIDFPTMTQTNLLTGHQRRVQRTSATSTAPEAKKSIQWYFTDDKGQLSVYSPTDSKAIESMYQTNTPGHLVINNNTYSFDFNRMCQINVSSQYRRAIQRKEVQPTLGATATEAETQEKESQEAPLKDLVVLLRGPKENLTKAKTKLEEKLKSLFKTSTISLPPVLTTALEKKLRQIAKRNEVSFALEEQAGKDAKSCKVLKLKGLTFSVQHATSAIQEEIINHQLSSSQESETQHPPEWQPQSHTTQLFPLTQGSPEWSGVEQRFKQTMQNRIVQIDRIQNTWLWENYVMHKKRLGLKNDGIINEKELFHGTRGNDPKLIYEGENGFDMRFSASGMWGQANYFAVNASYSHGYAHPTSDGSSREMFLVKVLTGDSYNCSSNSALRMPPVKQTSGGGKVQLAQMRYDTVTGTTGGSQVFMTYDNDKAYPAYLIKYS